MRCPRSVGLVFAALSLGCTFTHDLCRFDGTCPATDPSVPPAACPAPDKELSDAVRLDTESDTTCAVRATGSLVCWGSNATGVLDAPSKLPWTAAPLTIIPSNVRTVMLGRAHGCVITADGRVMCFGANSFSQLARDPLSFEWLPPNDALAQDGTPVTAKQGGARGYHTCVVGTDGGVRCWGYNIGGVCGAPTTVDNVLRPNVVALPTGTVTSLVTATFHACASTGNQVECWGGNGGGQLGAPVSTPCPNSLPCTAAPVAVQFPASAGIALPLVALGAGELFTCGIDSARKVVCWGDPTYGQTGDTRFSQTNVSDPLAPHVVSGLPATAQALSLGKESACALLADHSVWCWGRNDGGQLGRGGADTVSHPEPRPVSGIANASEVSLGDHHGCVIERCGAVGGRVRCWGANSVGQLGDGTTQPRSTPSSVVTVLP